MYGDEFEKSEKIGESRERQPGQYAEVWEGAMEGQDVPEFNGGKPWGYVEPAEAPAGGEQVAMPVEVKGAGAGEAQSLQGAGKMMEYGLDTASRVYGLGTVLEAIRNTDESGRDAANPIGAIYQQVAPTPEARQQLYVEIQKDAADQAGEGDEGKIPDKLGMDAAGNFFAKTQALENDGTVSVEQPDAANQAVWATKRLLSALETSETFAGLRERAAENGQGVVDYLMREQANPTLAQFFGAMDGELGAGDAEAVLQELEEQEEQLEEAEEQAEEAEEELAEVEELDEALEETEEEKLAQLREEVLRQLGK